jgi:hypothetical protein
MGGPLRALPSGLLAALLLAVAAHASSRAQLQLTLDLTSSNTLSVTTPAGAVLTSSGTIPPGTYQVIVNNDVPDIRDVDHMFHFSGPGVILLTDMGAGDNKTESYQETLVNNATYVFQDDKQPAIGRITMTTSSTAPSGSSTGSTGGGSSSGGGGTSSNTGGSGTSSNSSILSGGSTKAAAFRGSLAGVVSSGGAISLTKNGKPVTQLKAGRYRITVTDKAPAESFTVQKIRSTAHTLTGSSFVGRHTVTLTLTTGQWFYYPSFTGKKIYFIVTA